MKKKLSEKEIDKIVIEQGDDDLVWEEPIHIRKTKPISLSMWAEFATRTSLIQKKNKGESS